MCVPASFCSACPPTGRLAHGMPPVSWVCRVHVIAPLLMVHTSMDSDSPLRQPALGRDHRWDPPSLWITVVVWVIMLHIIIITIIITRAAAVMEEIHIVLLSIHHILWMTPCPGLLSIVYSPSARMNNNTSQLIDIRGDHNLLTLSLYILYITIIIILSIL